MCINVSWDKLGWFTLRLKDSTLYFPQHECTLLYLSFCMLLRLNQNRPGFYLSLSYTKTVAENGVWLDKPYSVRCICQDFILHDFSSDWIINCVFLLSFNHMYHFYELSKEYVVSTDKTNFIFFYHILCFTHHIKCDL